jgi:dihydroorotase-like cyclic amidohydrolase
MNRNNYFSKLLSVIVIFLFFVIFKTNSAIIKDETLVLTNITIIDGNGGKPLKHMSIIISNGYIEDIFQSGSKDIPEKSTVMDLPGHYVIPGLIDSHYHFMIGMRSKEIEELFRQFALLGGITTVRDMAGDAVELAILKKASEDGTVLSPRIYFSALMRGTIDERMKGISHGLPIGEAPWALVVTGQTDIVKAVAGAKSTGATGIKLYSDLSLELIIKITNEAHKQGLKVWSHSAIYPVKPSDAVNAGVDVL